MTAPDTDTLRALLERVEGATEELPLAEAKTLVDACGFDPDAAYLLTVAITDGPLNATGYAVAFHEAVLPRGAMGLAQELHTRYWNASSRHLDDNSGRLVITNATHAIAPLAIIAATLKALIAKGESE